MYRLGRNGSTKSRLAMFTSARLEIDPREGTVEIIGNEAQRKLSRLCIEITLQQQNNGRITADLDAIERRDDVTIYDVPGDAVAFLLGAKGAALRGMETKHCTFMFFDNDSTRNGKKRLYILGDSTARKDALRDQAVHYKLSGNRSLASWRERDGGMCMTRSRRLVFLSAILFFHFSFI